MNIHTFMHELKLRNNT